MNKPLQRMKPAPPQFHVGEPVRILSGFGGVVGEAVEDSGNIGAQGERIYGVRMKMDQWNEMTSEFPEDSLEAVRA